MPDRTWVHYLCFLNVRLGSRSGWGYSIRISHHEKSKNDADGLRKVKKIKINRAWKDVKKVATKYGLYYAHHFDTKWQTPIGCDFDCMIVCFERTGIVSHFEPIWYDRPHNIGQRLFNEMMIRIKEHNNEMAVDKQEEA